MTERQRQYILASVTAAERAAYPGMTDDDWIEDRQWILAQATETADHRPRIAWDRQVMLAAYAAALSMSTAVLQ